MPDEVESHYAKGGDLAAAIADSLHKSGKDIASLKTEDLSSVDEFHIRGRKSTLELAEHVGQLRTSLTSAAVWEDQPAQWLRPIAAMSPASI